MPPLYNGTIYRPPAEANTLLLPVTEGCTHNKCRFCNMYKDVHFRRLTDTEICAWLNDISTGYGSFVAQMKRICLVGADPFALSAAQIGKVLARIHEYLPNIKTVTMYAAIRNIKTKTDADLTQLHNMGINDLYVGVESGLDWVLKALNKGITVQDIREQCLRLNNAGITHRDMLMLGTAGQGHAEENALASAALENEINPSMILLTTMGCFEDTDLNDDILANRFVPCGETEILTEEKIFLENINLPKTYLWAAHDLNSVPLKGVLGENREQMLQTLAANIANMDDAAFKKNFVRDHF